MVWHISCILYHNSLSSAINLMNKFSTNQVVLQTMYIQTTILSWYQIAMLLISLRTYPVYACTDLSQHVLFLHCYLLLIWHHPLHYKKVILCTPNFVFRKGIIKKQFTKVQDILPWFVIFSHQMVMLKKAQEFLV